MVSNHWLQYTRDSMFYEPEYFMCHSECPPPPSLSLSRSLGMCACAIVLAGQNRHVFFIAFFSIDCFVVALLLISRSRFAYRLVQFQW